MWSHFTCNKDLDVLNHIEIKKKEEEEEEEEEEDTILYQQGFHHLQRLCRAASNFFHG